MNKQVIIIGASGHGKVIADIVLKSGDTIKGFLDDFYENDTFIGFPVLGKSDNYMEYNDCYFIVAIGNPIIRERIVNHLRDVKFYTAIHPQAIISSIGVHIGEGTVIISCADIGKHCIINTSSVVEHDNVIEDYVHVSVGTKLAGTVHVGKSTWVGVGATVKNNVSICDDCMIGAGAVVVKDIKEKGTYIGVPARIRVKQ